MTHMPPVDNRDASNSTNSSDDPDMLSEHFRGTSDADPVEPDWYGWRARQKRKNDEDDDPRRIATERLLAIASALSALAVIVIGIAIIVGIITQPLVTTRLVTATPALVAASAGPSNTPRLAASPRLAFSATPTGNPQSSPSLIRPALPQIIEFTSDLGTVRTVNSGAPMAGYVYRGLAIGPTGLLFAARTINAGVDSLRCNPDEGYLIIDRPTGLVGTIKLTQMVAPKAIAFDTDGRAFILAHYTEDCKNFTQALLAFEGSPRQYAQYVGLFRFESLVADALLITLNDRIFVTLSGFAGGISQKHLIELHWDSSTRALEQIQDYGDDVYDARYKALAVVDETLVMVRMRPGEACSFRTLSLHIDQTTTDPAQPGFLTSVPTLTALASPTPYSIEPGPTLPDQACPAVLATDPNAASPQLIGLSVTGNVAAKLSLANGAAQSYITLPVTRPTGMVIDPKDGHWFVASTTSTQR